MVSGFNHCKIEFGNIADAVSELIEIKISEGNIFNKLNDICNNNKLNYIECSFSCGTGDNCYVFMFRNIALETVLTQPSVSKVRMFYLVGAVGSVMFGYLPEEECYKVAFNITI